MLSLHNNFLSSERQDEVQKNFEDKTDDIAQPDC